MESARASSMTINIASSRRHAIFIVAVAVERPIPEEKFTPGT